MTNNPTWITDKAPGDLEAQIAVATAKGYALVDRTSRTATLIKKKHFSWFWAIVWLLGFGVGILVYLAYYGMKSDKTVHLSLGPVVAHKKVVHSK